jgi:hypothetical protein
MRLSKRLVEQKNKKKKKEYVYLRRTSVIQGHRHVQRIITNRYLSINEKSHARAKYTACRSFDDAVHIRTRPSPVGLKRYRHYTVYYPRQP